MPPDTHTDEQNAIRINKPVDKSEKQKSASRANGTHSRGPATPEGKRKSARNSFRHGLLAKAVVFEGESREQFAALLKAFCDELQPQTPIEDLLVQKMAVNHWRQERIWGQQKTRALQQSSEQETSPGESEPDGIQQPDSRLATHMNVTEMRYDRQFDRALDRLIQYRAVRENPQTPHAKIRATRPAKTDADPKFTGTNLGTSRF